MPSKILCLERSGLQATPIEIEVDTRQGLPHFHIVGLPDAAIEEAKQRVESAIKNSGLPYPRGKIVVNLAPAHVHKVGTHYDLAIALGILAEMGLLDKKRLENTIPLGELALDGSIRPILGALVFVCENQKKDKKALMIPVGNIKEASMGLGAQLLPVQHLLEAVGHFSRKEIAPYIQKEATPENLKSIDPWAYIIGQPLAKKAVEIAAAGHHSILLWGPPGTGKTLLAKSLIDLLPPLSQEEKLEVMQIHSILKPLSTEQNLFTERPFRSIHPRSSLVSLLGGGMPIKPGELSLAHRGVLLMDEFLEFESQTLESLRQPLEEKRVIISRHRGSIEFPADTLVIGTFNPCPCGFFEIPNRTCSCNAAAVQHYQKKLSGPLLDRIDLMAKTLPADFNEPQTSEPFEKIQNRILKARKIQQERFQSTTKSNAHMENEDLKNFCALDDKTKKQFLKRAEDQKISWRSLNKILKIARTLADLNESRKIEYPHLMEAFTKRPKPIRK